MSKGGKCGRLESGVGWVSGENDKERNKWGTLESGVGGGIKWLIIRVFCFCSMVFFFFFRWGFCSMLSCSVFISI